MHFAIGRGSLPAGLGKGACKVFVAGEAALLGDGIEFFISFGQQAAGLINSSSEDFLCGASSGAGFEGGVETASAHGHRIGEVSGIDGGREAVFDELHGLCDDGVGNGQFSAAA